MEYFLILLEIEYYISIFQKIEHYISILIIKQVENHVHFRNILLPHREIK